MIIFKNITDLFLNVLPSIDVRILNNVACKKAVLIVLNNRFLIMEADCETIGKCREKRDEETK